MRRWAICVVVVVAVAGCGDDSTADAPNTTANDSASVRVGAAGATFTSGALRVTVGDVTDEGGSAATGDGTLQINPDQEATHTFIRVEITVENVTDTPNGFTHESIRASSADGEVSTSFVCDEQSSGPQCAAQSATWYVYPGTPRDFTVFFVAEQDTEQFEFELGGEDVEPPEVPEAP